MQYQQALKVIKTITLYYQNFVVTEEKVKEWADEIQHHSLDEVTKRLKEHAKESKFPPTLADLIEKKEESKSAAYVTANPEYIESKAEEAKRLLIELEGERFTEPAELPDFLKNRGHK